jgi:hypothetical protein
MGGTVRLTLLLFACLHVTVPAAPPHSGESGERHASQAIDKAELPQGPPRANSHTNMVSAVADSRPPAVARRLPLDVVLVKQRLYEPPTTLRFAVVTPFDPDNREAGVELRCNSQAVTSTIWTLHEKSNTVREFDWKIIDETCLYELVAVLVRTKDYLYLYQMVPSRLWLSHKIPMRQFGRGSRF